MGWLSAARADQLAIGLLIGWLAAGAANVVLAFALTAMIIATAIWPHLQIPPVFVSGTPWILLTSIVLSTLFRLGMWGVSAERRRRAQGS